MVGGELSPLLDGGTGEPGVMGKKRMAAWHSVMGAPDAPRCPCHWMTIEILSILSSLIQ